MSMVGARVKYELGGPLFGAARPFSSGGALESDPGWFALGGSGGYTIWFGAELSLILCSTVDSI